MDEGGRQGLGRLVLKALAICSAIAFLTIVMVNACATYAPATKARARRAERTGGGIHAGARAAADVRGADQGSAGCQTATLARAGDQVHAGHRPR